MSTGAKVFLASATFSGVTALSYWIVSSEPTGTTLLGFMVLAPLLVAVYLFAQARGARVLEDRPEVRPGDAAGESLGKFPTDSVWPVLLGAAGLAVALGLAYGIWVLVPSLVLFAVVVIGFVRESRG